MLRDIRSLQHTIGAAAAILLAIAPEAAADQTIRVGQGALGRGYNALTGAVIQRCVEQRVDGSDGDQPKPLVELNAQIATSTSELNRMLARSAAVRYGLVKGSLAQFSSSRSTRNDLYVLTEVTVSQAYKSAEFTLKRSFADVLQKSPLDFYNKCGTHFLESSYRTARFVFLLRIHAESEADSELIAGSLGGSVGSLSGDIAATRLRSLQDSTASIEVHEIGRTASAGKLKADAGWRDYVDYAQEFGDDVLTDWANKKTWWTSVEFTAVPYRQHVDDAEGAEDFERQQLYVQKLDDANFDGEAMLDAVKQYEADHEFALTTLSPEELKKRPAEIEQKAARNRESREKCEQDPMANCRDEVVSFSMDGFYFVERWVDLYDAMHDMTTTTLGFVGKDFVANIVLRGKWCDGGQGIECRLLDDGSGYIKQVNHPPGADGWSDAVMVDKRIGIYLGPATYAVRFVAPLPPNRAWTDRSSKDRARAGLIVFPRADLDKIREAIQH